MEFLKEQLDAVFEDIFPDSVKIGMVSSGELIDVIADRLRYYNAKNIVVDPVMVATSGADLIKTNAIKELVLKLLPLATLVTPNIPEAAFILGKELSSPKEYAAAAQELSDRLQTNVLLKGIHPAAALCHLKLTAHANSNRVIPPVFKDTQALYYLFRRLIFSNVSNYSAHIFVTSPFPL